MNIPRSRRARRWLSFSLRSLLLVMTVAAIGLGLYVKSLRDRKAAVTAIEKLNGVMGVKYTGPAWLRKLVGDDKYFYDPAGVHFNTQPNLTDDQLRQVVRHLEGFDRLRDLTLAGSDVTDAGLAHLGPLAGKLQHLDVSNTSITDGGLMHLQTITSLKVLRITNTSITDAAATKFQKVLPECKVQR